MLGAGTRPATTTNKAPRLLDLTRLVSRAGRVLTGVDRVERAYLAAFLDDDVPAFALIRTRWGYIVLDRAGMDVLLRACADGTVPADVLPSLRRHAIARVPKVLLGRMLRRRFKAGLVYVNTGHSNLSQRVVTNLRWVPDARIVVLIHDTIPLDYPEYQAAGATARFEAFLNRACLNADLLIYNSEQTHQDVARHAPAGLPEGIVAHLGIDSTTAAPEDIPPSLQLNAPYFITIGTIEPRKAHDVLLDVWDRLYAEMGANAPDLLLCGTRGWNNEDVFKRLDSLPSDMPVHEIAGLSDGALKALIQGATALLFPSHAEGFGLPPAEAAVCNTTIVCNDLPIYREFLGNIPVYAPSGDGNLWYQIVMRAYTESLTSGCSGQQTRQGWQAPTWEQHFSLVMPQL